MIDCVPILAESKQMIPLYFGLHTLYVFITRDEQRTAVKKEKGKPCQIAAGASASCFAFRLEQVRRWPTPSIAYSVLRTVYRYACEDKADPSLICYIKNFARHASPVPTRLSGTIQTSAIGLFMSETGLRR